MKVVDLTCPNCGGQLQLPPEARDLPCPYCGANLLVDLDADEVRLRLAEQKERLKDEDRLEAQRDRICEQYDLEYSEVQGLDADIARLSIQVRNQKPRASRSAEVSAQSRLARRDELTRHMATLQVDYDAINSRLTPELRAALRPIPPRPVVPRAPSVWPPRIIAIVGVGLLGVLVWAIAQGKIALPAIDSPFVQASATPTSIPAPPAPPSTGYVFAKETRHSVEAFAATFLELGGVGALGFPITQAFVERQSGANKALWVQYFEKAVLEYHPELPDGSKYQLARLGALRLAERYKSGTPRTAPLPGPESYRFAETGFTVRDPFLRQWKAAGELKRNGFPLSESFEETSAADGKTRVVQYFERVVMEYHPDLTAPFDVQLSALGSLRLKSLYPSGAPDKASEPVSERKP